MNEAGQRAIDRELQLQLSPYISWIADEEGAAVFLSPQWTSSTGLSVEQSLREGWLKAVCPPDRKRVVKAWHEAVAGRAAFSVEVRLELKDGSHRWFQARASAAHDQARKPFRWYGTLADVHERKLAELALSESEALHRSLLEASTDCIKVLSPDGLLTLINGPGLGALEVDDFESIRDVEWALMWPDETRGIVREAVREAGLGENSRFAASCPTAKGTLKWWDVIVSPVLESGKITRLLSISRDITSQRHASERIRHASEHDVLTELPNRRAFQMHIDAAVLRAMEKGTTIALLLIDVDHFKHINDSFGHPAGDHLLRTFAERLRGSIRATDFAARLGGDEFAVILEDLERDDAVHRIAETILARIKAPIEYDGRVINGAVSVGGALYPREAGSANELLKNADIALYATKQEGRCGFRMFQNHLRQEAQKSSSQRNLAELAISGRHIVPYYQPKVRLETGEIYGFEALLRWHHPGLGVQFPDSLAEAFQHFELASQIGELMQLAVIRDLGDWERRGVQVGPASINAAPAEFLRDDYAETLLARLENGLVSPSRIEVEITEHAFLDRAAGYVERAIRKLSDRGVRIALDDFGTGYSSLSHVKDFPVDVLKIDRSFVSNLEDGGGCSAIVSAVVGLARNLGIEVVAEGIETEAQRQFLINIGCDAGQGFLFARAACGTTIPSLMSQSQNTGERDSSSSIARSRS